MTPSEQPGGFDWSFLLDFQTDIEFWPYDSLPEPEEDPDFPSFEGNLDLSRPPLFMARYFGAHRAEDIWD